MRARSIAAALPSGSARKPVLLLALGTFALGTDAFVISGVLPRVGADLGVSLSVAGLLITVFSGVYAVGAPVIAVLTGNMCRRRALLIAMSVFVLANVVAAIAPNYAIMVVARVVAALGAAMYTPAASAVAAQLAAPQERGRALAVVLGGLTLATALGVPLGTLVGQAADWRTTFVFVAVLGLIALVGLARSLEAMPSTGVASLRQRIVVAGTRGVPSSLLATALSICGVFVIYTYLAWFAGLTAGITGSLLTVVYLIFGICAVISNLVAGVLIDRMAPAKVAVISMAGLMVAFLALSALARLGTPGVVAAVVLCVIVAVWSLLGWMFNPAQQQRLLGVAGPHGPVVLSLNASALYLGQAIAGVIGGVLLTSGPSVLPIAAVGCEVLAVGAMLISARRTARPVVPAAEPAATPA
ncbi:MFS transporter [Kutzneria chonburiensis]|jgi:DHA1 family inner membrane transport protein|uniref:MFS transporter n=1 Tax=Kutzneria chonburiensis TaxID=1483604 RepID=A0ABV6N5I3_9PSEU|nr:MFS transporter [Kutzneria chonburiensis]